MLALFSVLIVITLSILITRVATIALTHTGLARQAAQFQARSAFTGVGFTTSEAEKVVNHPVRRRILMLLMLLGNAGIVTVVASTILTFVSASESGQWLLRMLFLVAGIFVLWMLAQSKWLDRHLSHLVSYLLTRWTNLDTRDYASLLKIGGDYQVMELLVEENDWIAGKTLAESRLREEGILLLGYQQRDGIYVGVPTASTRIEAGQVLILYGTSQDLEALDTREAGVSGTIEHAEAVVTHKDEFREETDQVEEAQRDAD